MSMNKREKALLRDIQTEATTYKNRCMDLERKIDMLRKERDNFIITQRDVDILVDKNAQLHADMNALHKATNDRIKESILTAEAVFGILCGMNKMAKDLYNYGERTPRP